MVIGSVGVTGYTAVSHEALGTERGNCRQFFFYTYKKEEKMMDTFFSHAGVCGRCMYVL